jgi:Putative Ig domain/Domain of unknown function DUF11
MSRRPLVLRGALVAVAALFVSAAYASGPAQAATKPAAKASAVTTAAASTAAVQPSCPAATPGTYQCFALHQVHPTEPSQTKTRAASPADAHAGFGPSDLLSAYNLPANGGAGQTVAIVDAYDDPNAESDLAAYRTQYGLPDCTTANGCFSKVDQTGGNSYPGADAGWAGEISLDLDMVSAIAPAAHILLVEADDAYTDNLGAAVNRAVLLGAKFVSNSWGSNYEGTPGSGEDPSDLTADHDYFDHPGVAIVASAGDSGYGVSYPAASPNVVSVGGTSLFSWGNARGWTESVWGGYSFTLGTGSGCSVLEPKPAWQTDIGCAHRTVADVSAVADPDTGVAVYDTYGDYGWDIFGGTSVSAPIIASVYADAGTPLPGTNPAAYPYQNQSGLYDVTQGLNAYCFPYYLCMGEPGYDAPTGLGTPNGLASFTGLPPVSVANPGDQYNVAGDLVSLQLSASGGVGPYYYQADSLPVGLDLNSSTGVISGQLVSAITTTAVVHAVDAYGFVGTAVFTWHVSAAAPANIAVVSGDGQSVQAGHAYAAPLVTSLSDAFGNPVSGATVTYAVTSGAANFAGAASAGVSTNAAGLATSPALTATNPAGAVTVTASVGALSTSFTETSTVAPTKADLALTMTGPATIKVGKTGNINVIVHNPGSTGAKVLTTTVSVGPGLSIVSANNAGAISGGTVTWHLASIAKGATHTYWMVVRATAAGTGQLTGNVTAATPDPFLPNNHFLLNVHLQ